MSIKFDKYEINNDGKRLYIIVPKKVLSELYVCEIDSNRHIIFGDKTSLYDLAIIVNSLKNNPNYILYIPSKKKTTEYLSSCWRCDTAFDLVIVHHSVQLKIKTWKNIRQKLNQKDTLSLEENIISYPNFEKYSFVENKDILVAKSRFDTLFLVGSDLIFSVMAFQCEDISSSGEGIFRESRSHTHAHLDMCFNYKVHRSGKERLTIEYYDKTLWLGNR